jgi:hypothetical protein
MIAKLFRCDDCKRTLMTRPQGGLLSSGWERDWFMVKDHVWNASQRKGACRFLCVTCLERRIGRTLTPADFRRSARVNFVGRKSVVLRRRTRGLIPTGRLKAQTTIGTRPAKINNPIAAPNIEPRVSGSSNLAFPT